MNENSFSAVLAEYLKELGVNASKLSKASGLSRSVISRYLSGMQQPAADGRSVEKLSKGFASLYLEQNRSKKQSAAAYEKQVREDLLFALTGMEETPGQLGVRLKKLLEATGRSASDLAREMNFDPSYISRILSGQRQPANLPAFLTEVSAQIAATEGAGGITALARILERMPEELAAEESRFEAVRAFLSKGEQGSRKQMGKFLSSLDSFDLNEFTRKIRFDEVKVPTVPFQFPTSKTYCGIDEMMQAELDFLKAAVLSRSKKDVILYSDMPLEEMAEDPEFKQKWAGGIALLLKKGVRLHNIHDIHRPFGEMLLGLENWIPLYMTGLITSYYLPEPTNHTFLHILRSAGSCALSGEAIAGNQAGGRYLVTKAGEDVHYFRQRAKELLSLSRPLIRTYPGNQSAAYDAVRKTLFQNGGTFRFLFSAPPLFSIGEEPLSAMLQRAGVREGVRAKIFEGREASLLFMRELLKDPKVRITFLLPEYSAEEFASMPPCLSVSDLFLEEFIPYTAEEYAEHLSATRAFAASFGNLDAAEAGDEAFRNIRIIAKEEGPALLSKSGSPVIHFLIDHPKLSDSIFRFTSL